MRWLLRLILFWAICAPLFYVFGLPLLLEKVSAKARADGFTQCIEHFNKPDMALMASHLPQPERDAYCHCATDEIALTKADLPDLVQRRQPARLTAAMQQHTEQCNTELQRKINSNLSAGGGVPPVQDDFNLSQ